MPPSTAGPGKVGEPEPPPDTRPEEMQQLQADFLDAILAVKGHFGDRDPRRRRCWASCDSAASTRGKNPEDDALLASMDAGSGAAASHIAQPSSKES